MDEDTLSGTIWAGAFDKMAVRKKVNRRLQESFNRIGKLQF